MNLPILSERNPQGPILSNNPLLYPSFIWSDWQIQQVGILERMIAWQPAHDGMMKMLILLNKRG